MSTGPSLYRRHRPRTFADVVGQEHVVRTLRNAVEQGKVHHAYLFVGSRGTGKTSMAKILAACLNCVDGPTVTPCGVCPSCVAIANATSLDVIEMDAASNNSVDDIRELRDKVGFAPVSGRSKVYILDEAHMLSTAAWNAFLKTLEEPPPDTIFVLATTEAGKVLDTVVDRCHRFDFGRPTTEQLAGVVARVAAQEQITIPPEAVALVARHATGSFRDALGTLEQLVTYSGTTVTLQDALAVLGVADDEMLFGVLDAIGASDAPAALRAVHAVAQSGRDLGLFARDLETYARELMVTQTLGGVPPEIAVTADRDARVAAQAQRVAPGDVIRLLDLLAAMQRATRDGADARTQLEVALVKAATPQVDATTRALLARLERLEHGGVPAAQAPVSVPVAASAPAPAAPPVAAPAPAAPPAPAPTSTAAPAAAPEPAAISEPAAVPAPRPAPIAPGALDLDAARALWPAVVETVKTDNALLGAVMGEAHCVGCEDGELVVAFADSAKFARRRAEDSANREVVLEALRALSGLPLRLRYETYDEATAPLGAHAPAPPTEDEMINRFKSAFDAEEIIPGEEPHT